MIARNRRADNPANSLKVPSYSAAVRSADWLADFNRQLSVSTSIGTIISIVMLIFTNGRLTREIPPLIPAHLYVPETATANPLPQALVLTAIVISFSFFAFLLVLAFRAYQELGTDEINKMRVAEPENEQTPPQGY